jgi:virulence factor Mce-like protein
MRRRGTASIAASPVLVGAVTVLITVIAVFIAYQANQGLPFVPTYDVRAEVPNAHKLVRGNEVRAGGFRVGIVEKLTSARRVVNGEERAVAVLHMKLDKTIEPLAVDTKVGIRPRSALGLKFVDLSPGNSEDTFAPGSTIPLRNARMLSGEVEDYTALFDRETRPSMQSAITGFGSALAGRGPDINETIEQLAPFLRRLTPVMRNLSDPETELANLFPSLARFVGEIAPVARENAEFFANQATTYAAIGRDPQALQDSISEGPPTLSTSIRSLRVQRPFLARFADLSRRLRPGARELRISLPPINRALRVGTPVLLRVPELGDDLEELSASLEDLGRNPNTLLALRDLRTAVTMTGPLLEAAAPYQTVCNYFIYFWVPTGAHLSQTVRGPDGRALGTSQRVMSILGSRTNNGLGTSASSRPVDVPPGTDPQSSAAGPALHTQSGGPAVDAQGNADCQVGQWGYIDRLATDDRWGPNQPGGAHIVVDPDTPGLAGGTWVTRRLGINNVRDLP